MHSNKRIPFIAGNWKMNTTVAEARKLVTELRRILDKYKGVEIAVCPPFVSITTVKEILAGSLIKVGAQNLYFEEKGAYTGEISPMMLAPLCEYVIIGHSERRQYFQETGDLINKKIKAAIKADLKPILCVGEKLEENEAGQTAQVVVNQIKAALGDIKDTHGLVIAYEPIWAIGTGKAATGKQSNETIGLIRNTVASLTDNATANSIRILYGGSVTAENIAEFISQPEIDGGLVGGASLKVDQFTHIVQKTNELKGIEP
jgi:triosephosphate isomerase (TIM)